MPRATSPQILAVIPARYDSTRFPGKMLALLSDKSLIQRTYENAQRCHLLDEILVATDDKRIFDHVESFGGKAVMTSPDCPNGTSRAEEVIQSTSYQDTKVILNIQGDEPCVHPQTLESVVTELLAGDAPMATAITPITDATERMTPSVVKCVIDGQGRALYFSRAPIPGCKIEEQLPPTYRHLGIYAFKKDFLHTYVKLPATPLQQIEDLEQLKVLEHGYAIQTAIVNESAIGVDTPEDLEKVETWLKNQSSSLSPAESSPL